MFESDVETTVSSAKETVIISRKGPVVMIGERINPTGRERLMDALERDDMSIVQKDAIAQVQAGAAILDVNAGVPGADEPRLLVHIIEAVREVTDAPLCFDSNNPEALRQALQAYDGKALINSVNGEEESLQNILPLVKEYGAAVIGLAMDDDGIPATAEGRFQVARKIVSRADEVGIPQEDVIIDPLVLTVGASTKAPQVTLEATCLTARELGVNITMGASNVSHGLPNRAALNASFLSMAIACGLSCPITNPLVRSIREAILASNLLMGHDEWAMQWIQYCRENDRLS
ncbi:MAG: dihydropteroate synthase [Chloroflexota bacterium]|nr:dihydropteroate synthase [Chloroflexota bacterium]